MFLLSIKAGLRAKEIAALTWGIATDAEGRVSDIIHLQNRASKGKTGGRSIPMHAELAAALVTLQAEHGEEAAHDLPVIYSNAGGACRQHRCNCGFIGSIARWNWPGVRRILDATPSLPVRRGRFPKRGGSLRDVQDLAGHASLAMTQRYIEGDTEAKRKLIALI